MFAGIWQIVHTPFFDDGSIDWRSLETQLDFSVAAGVHGLVLPAMASEFFTLTDDERKALVARVFEHVGGQVPVIGCVQGVSLAHALSFAEHAAEVGVDGLMAMPPYLRKASRDAIAAYMTALAGFDRPLIIQNASAPVGTTLEPAFLAELLRTVDGIRYVKEESPPILHRISSLAALATSGCDGIFGGANGMYLLDEMARGACGNMPAGGFIDVQVKVYEAAVNDEPDVAEALQHRLLPLLGYASMYGATFHKHLLHRRGVLATPSHRDPQGIPIDAADAAAIERAWSLVADEALAAYPYRS